MKFSEALDRFGSYQRDILGRAENTVKSYREEVEKFAEFFGTDSIEEVTKKDAENYASWMAKKGLAPATRCRKISALQMFFAWAYDNSLVAENPFRSLAKPKIPQKQVLAMSQEEVHEVLEVARNRNHNHKDYFRNLTLFTVMVSTGLRRNEIVNVRLEDVNIAENRLFVATGKGNKQRVVYFSDEAKALLSEWIAAHRKLYKYAEESEYLFLTQKSGQMDVSMVNRIVNGLYKEAQMEGKGFVVHSTRKTFATTVYDNTQDIAVVQSLLGHSSPQTTMRYISIHENSKKMAAQMVRF